LSAVPAGFDKGFFDVGFAHAQGSHALGELLLLLQMNSESTHNGRLASGGYDLKQLARLGVVNPLIG
jgi:hypothetical protein